MVELGFNPAMGARPLRRVIQEQIEDRVADYFLDHPTSQQLEARISDGEITMLPPRPQLMPRRKSKVELNTVCTYHLTPTSGWFLR